MRSAKLLLALPFVACGAENSPTPPNIIIIMADDQGYQDLGCYSSPDIKTPVIDKLASEGLRLTDFYQAASISSASRAALLTGRLNTKNGVTSAYFPNENGLPTSEITIAEAIKEQGYTTACIGKWHLGDAEECMPRSRGFDEFFGIPYSNDMYITPSLPISESVNFRCDYTLEMAVAEQQIAKRGRGFSIKSGIRNRVPLVEGGEIIEFPCDQASLTGRYFDRAINFITRSKEEGKPFFLYITPAMPHVPLYASEQFLGRSERGLYGDCVEEIDWNIGRLLDALDAESLSDNTIVIYTSDNGPYLGAGEDGGTALPLRDGKFTHYEGGVRVPFIIRWRGVIPEGVVSDAVIRSIDLFPTFMHYAGADSLNSSQVDGVNVSSFFESPKEHEAEYDEYIYVKGGKVHGVRKGDWVYLPHSGANGKNADFAPELFNLRDDISESENLIELYPEKLAELKELYELKVENEK